MSWSLLTGGATKSELIIMLSSMRNALAMHMASMQHCCYHREFALGIGRLRRAFRSRRSAALHGTRPAD